MTETGETAALLEEARAKYLQGQERLQAIREAEELVRRGGGSPDELAGDRARLEAQLDVIADLVRQREAVLAARTAAGGGDALTVTQARHFLLGISASARFLALYDKAPEHGARMINNLLTTPEIKAPDFETRLGFIATQLQQA